ncbi:MAG: hypothetical protein IRZ13_18960 [Acetobacteraceae bacterium]|nr:hypothetical protein [Acetobacteraceae bacterium]
MDRINGANTVDIGGGKRGFRDRNLLAGLSGTQVTAAFLNAVQEELLAVIEGAGLAPDENDWTQLRKAIQILGRIEINDPLTLYVSPTGNDANDGRTVGTPFKTIQKAWDTLAHDYDLKGRTATIQLAPGTYNAGLLATGTLTGQNTGPVGGLETRLPAGVVLRGDPVTPSNVIINVAVGPAVMARNGARLEVTGVRLLSGGAVGTDYDANGRALAALTGAVVVFGSVEFGACTDMHISATHGGYVSSNGEGYSIVGDAPNHVYASTGGIAILAGSAVTLQGTRNFSRAFAQAQVLGSMFLYNMIFGGSATGTRYVAQANGVIATNGGGASYLPGDAAGTTDTGGQYI